MKRELDKWGLLWILAKIWLIITFGVRNGNAPLTLKYLSKKKKKKKFFPKSMDNVQRSTGANFLFLPQTKEKLQCYPICSNYFTIPYSYFIVEKKRIFFYLLFFFPNIDLKQYLNSIRKLRVYLRMRFFELSIAAECGFHF
jgi:hypothetical protein